MNPTRAQRALVALLLLALSPLIFIAAAGLAVMLAGAFLLKVCIELLTGD